MNSKIELYLSAVRRVALLAMLFCLTVALTGVPAPAQAMGWYMEPAPLANDLASADFVVVGMLYNGDANTGGGTTEVAILTIVKGHPGLGDKKHFTLKRYVPTKDDSPTYLLFGAVVKDEIEVYRGIQCTGKKDELIAYLKGIRSLEKTSTYEQLAFYFDHLEHRQSDIAQDACRVFHNATYRELKFASDAYDVEKLKGWLADEKVPEARKELYRVLLVFCQAARKR